MGEAALAPVPRAAFPSGPVVRRPLRAAGAALAVGSVTSYLGFVVLTVGFSGTDPDLLEVGYVFAFLLFAVVGSLIVWHRPHNPLGWLLTLGGLAVVLSAALDAYAIAVLVSDDMVGPGVDWAAWTESWLYVGGWGAVTAFPLLLLPRGHLPSPRWRPVAFLTGTLVAISMLVTAFAPGPINDRTLPNPVGVDAFAKLFAWLESIVMWALVGVTLLGLVALVVRWRRAWGVERRQLAWPLLGVLAALVLMATSFGAAGVGATEAVTGSLVAVALGVFPVSIAVAVLREGLLDIELVLKRTLIYTVLSAVIVGSYVLALALASRWFATSADVAVSVLATVLVVLALGSLKTRLELWVSRALFGHGDQPQKVLAALAACGERYLDGASLLRELESELRTAIRVPFVAIRRDVGNQLASTPPEEGTEVFPLVHAGVELGRLEVARRSPIEPLTNEEVRLMEAAALQVAGLVRSAGLDTELRAARANLVRSREQERLRIRRDLHDGLGPVLAATTLQVDALRRRIEQHDTDGQAIADRVSAQLQSAVTDVRGLIEGLRPPALDQMGLVSSIEELVVPLRDAGVVVELNLRVPDHLDPATEVAAYRIAAEALTNVLRHSVATRCQVSASTNSTALLLVVLDDGCGLSGRVHAGVGMSSMADRAAELGGTLRLTPVEPHGTRLNAVLPLGEP